MLAAVVDEACDATHFLMALSAVERVAFVGTLGITKTLAWCLTVVAAARGRRYYVPLYYSNAACHARDAVCCRFPWVCAKAGAAADRAAAAALRSRSSLCLSGFLRIDVSELAPALAEGTIAFRCVWPLWFPFQCWAMISVWPRIQPSEVESIA